MKEIKEKKGMVDWITSKISSRQLIIILSIIIGIAVAIAAYILKSFVHYIHQFLYDLSGQDNLNFLRIIYPTVGILLVILFIKYINRRPVRHGIPSVLYAISKSDGKIRPHNLYSSIITSSITVGFGGSVGLEGPTVATGAAIGSNIGQKFNLSYKQTVLLLACACAGAMSAIFKAPIAAIVFALEVIMVDLTMAAIVPLLISSVSAALTSYLLFGQDVLYKFNISDLFQLDNVPFYIGMGILTGFISIYFSKMYNWITESFEKVKNEYLKLTLGGIILGILIYLLPELYGEGYEIINSNLAGDYTHLFNNTLYQKMSGHLLPVVFLFLLVLLFKPAATALTFGAGGVGGIFAPCLFMGANAGLFFAVVFEMLGFNLPYSSFALVGMAGLISGVIHAPLMSIFLIAEITKGYELFMPLMIVATISYTTARIFITNSVYTIQLAKRGELITHHKDKAVLMMMDLKSLIENDFNVLRPNDLMEDLINEIKVAHRNIFPVVDEDGTFRGIVKLDDIRHIIFTPDLYKSVYVRDLMFKPKHVIESHESIEQIAKKFQESGRFNIAYLEKGKYKGFISRAKLFSAYRKKLEEFSEH